MSAIGIILLYPHYPEPVAANCPISSRLAGAMKASGVAATEVMVFDAVAGGLPSDPTQCDAWILSGPYNQWGLEPGPVEPDFVSLVAGIVASGSPLLALYHAEHAVHAAMVGDAARAPQTPIWPRSIRDPITATRPTEPVFRWSQEAGRLVEIDPSSERGGAGPGPGVVGKLVARLAPSFAVTV